MAHWLAPLGFSNGALMAQWRTFTLSSRNYLKKEINGDGVALTLSACARALVSMQKNLAPPFHCFVGCLPTFLAVEIYRLPGIGCGLETGRERLLA
jgi:hypothetical protein